MSQGERSSSTTRSLAKFLAAAEGSGVRALTKRSAVRSIMGVAGAFAAGVAVCAASITPPDSAPVIETCARDSPPAAPAVNAGIQDAPLGVLIPAERLELTSPVEGRVEELFVVEGDVVRRGALLARVAGDEIELRVASARAALDAARAEAAEFGMLAAEARAEKERIRGSEGHRPRKLVEAVELQLRRATGRARAALRRASAAAKQVALLEQLSSKTELRAPFDGVIAARHVRRGDAVGPRAPIVELIDKSTLRVRLAIPESWIPEYPAASSIRMRVDGSGAVLLGRIDRLAPELDPAAGVLIAEAELIGGTAEQLPAPGAVVRVLPEEERSR